jgi:hypothetical protein
MRISVVPRPVTLELRRQPTKLSVLVESGKRNRNGATIDRQQMIDSK